MTIDKSGKWWTGTGPEDVADYLSEYEAGGYAVDETLHVRFSECGGTQFRLRADGDEGSVEPHCNDCGNRHAMLDSAAYQEDAEPEDISCPCGKRGLRGRCGTRDPMATSSGSNVGERCTRDGVLGSCADWKIDYSPTDHVQTHHRRARGVPAGTPSPAAAITSGTLPRTVIRRMDLSDPRS